MDKRLKPAKQDAPVVCERCGGDGSYPLYVVGKVFAIPCEQCGGTGERIPMECPNCGGAGGWNDEAPDARNGQMVICDICGGTGMGYEVPRKPSA